MEDDRLLSDALSRMLEMAGFTVYVTGFGEDGPRARDVLIGQQRAGIDVAVLDVVIGDAQALAARGRACVRGRDDCRPARIRPAPGEARLPA